MIMVDQPNAFVTLILVILIVILVIATCRTLSGDMQKHLSLWPVRIMIDQMWQTCKQLHKKKSIL